jgi:hypothetical protein
MRAIPSFSTHDEFDVFSRSVCPVQFANFFFGSFFQVKMHSRHDSNGTSALLSNDKLRLRRSSVITHYGLTKEKSHQTSFHMNPKLDGDFTEP